MIQKGETLRLDDGTIIIEVKVSTDGEISLKPLYWKSNVAKEINLEYRKEDKVTAVHSFTFNTPTYFVAGKGTLDFGQIYSGDENKKPKSDIDVYYNNRQTFNVTYSIKSLDGEGTVILKHIEDPSKTIQVSGLEFIRETKVSDDHYKIELDGVIQKVPNDALLGSYEGQIELEIHIN